MAKRTDAQQRMPDVGTGDVVDRMPSRDRRRDGAIDVHDLDDLGWSNDVNGGWSGPDGDRYSDSELLHSPRT